MMIDAKAKKFDKVVVKDVSRFARNTVDLLQSVRELKSYGVQVDFLNNGEVMEGGFEFILTILGAMAQQESANMSKRVKFGKTSQRKKEESIVRMLKNPIYTGKVTNKKSEVTDFITGTRKELPEEEWIVVERPEMRIISDELLWRRHRKQRRQ